LFRNGGHIDPPLFHDYLWLKSDFGVESAKRIIRFRRAHHSALRQAVEEIGADTAAGLGVRWHLMD